jgi:hypothetical protein
MTFRTDGPITTKHLLHKFGSTKQHITLTEAAADCPLGTVQMEAGAAGEWRGVALLGLHPGLLPMVAGEAIEVGEEVFSAADGKVQDRPVASGTYWYLGICVEQPAAGDGDVILVQHTVPVRVVIA